MTFWQKIKQTLRSFMDGRHGADQLSMALLWAGLIAYLLGTIFSGVQGFFLWPLLGILLTLAGIAAYVLCIFRMFSRNNDKRSAGKPPLPGHDGAPPHCPPSGQGALSEPEEIQILPLSGLQGVAGACPEEPVWSL